MNCRRTVSMMSAYVSNTLCLRAFGRDYVLLYDGVATAACSPVYHRPWARHPEWLHHFAARSHSSLLSNCAVNRFG